MKIIRILIIAGLAAFSTYLQAEIPTHTISFEVSGFLNCQFFRNDGSLFTNQLLKFEMRITGDQWQIKNFEGDSYWERSCDGTNIYHYFKDKETTLPGYGGFVESGTIPSGGYPVALPWLAYASSSACKNKTEFPAPWSDPRNDPYACAFEPVVHVSTNSPFLPESVIFVLTKELAAKAGVNPWLPKEGISLSDRQFRKNWMPKEPIGFTGGIYRVVSSTNIQGLSLANSFELLKYRQAYRRSATSSNSPIAAIYSSTNVFIRPLEPTPITPVTSDKPIFVMDMRFQDGKLNINYISYFITNRWITDQNSAELQTLFDLKKKSIPFFDWKSLSRNWKFISIYVLLGITFFLPLIILIYRMIRNMRRRNFSDK